MRIIRDKTDNHIQMLADLSRAFATSRDLQQTLSDALADIAESMEVEAGSLFLLTDNNRQLICRACYGPSDILNLRLPANTGVVGKAIASAEPSISRAESSKGFSGHVDSVTGFKTRSLLTAPLLAGDKVLGAIQLINPLPAEREFNQSSLEAIRVLAGAAALALVNAQLTADLVSQAKTQAELAMAREVQQALLQLNAPEESGMAGINMPARSVSGDFYSFMPTAQGTAFCIADVSGKGAHAGILMARVATLWRVLVKEGIPPDQMLSRINGEILETSYRGMFCTMIVGINDGKTVQCAMAGHEPILQYTGNAFEETPSSRPPLGVARWVSAPEVITLDLSRGPLYFYTDGVTDGLLPSGEPLGREGLEHTIRQIHSVPAQVQCEAIARRMTVQEEPLVDDLTLVIATRFVTA